MCRNAKICKPYVFICTCTHKTLIKYAYICKKNACVHCLSAQICIICKNMLNVRICIKYATSMQVCAHNLHKICSYIDSLCTIMQKNICRIHKHLGECIFCKYLPTLTALQVGAGCRSCPQRHCQGLRHLLQGLIPHSILYIRAHAGVIGFHEAEQEQAKKSRL